jgi:hypothetical protein
MSDTHEETLFKLKTLRLAVAAMREQQRLFFKSRNQSTLVRAKELEKKVDQMLEEGHDRQITTKP